MLPTHNPPISTVTRQSIFSLSDFWGLDCGLVGTWHRAGEHWVKSYYVTKSYEFYSLCFCSSEAEGEYHGIHWIQGIHSLPQGFSFYPSSGPYPLSPTAAFCPVHCSHWSQLFHATSILLLLLFAPPRMPLSDIAFHLYSFLKTYINW